ncbi:MAG: helix-turn-helix domain-containing protein [Candidatus Cyclobacteriaceae bacterium M2_1C_046]
MRATEKPQHIDRKIARIRNLPGMKQEALAQALGISQKAISKIEQSETVEEETLERVARVLGVTPKAIENFDEEAVINVIANTVNNHDSASGNALYMHKPSFNPIEKWIEALDENKRLYNEKISLLERLLEAEKEKNEILNGRSNN